MKQINCATLKIRGGRERDSYGKKAGKGALIQWDKAATLGVSQDQTLIIWNVTPLEVTGATHGNPTTHIAEYIRPM